MQEFAETLREEKADDKGFFEKMRDAFGAN